MAALDRTKEKPWVLKTTSGTIEAWGREMRAT